MLDDDLRVRVQRLASGRHRVEDLDRLFLGLRDRDGGRMSVREIGDFVAHRGERHKGPVTQTARDVFASVDVWSLPMRGRKPSRSATTTNSRLLAEQSGNRPRGDPQTATRDVSLAIKQGPGSAPSAGPTGRPRGRMGAITLAEMSSGKESV